MCGKYVRYFNFLVICVVVLGAIDVASFDASSTEITPEGSQPVIEDAEYNAPQETASEVPNAEITQENQVAESQEGSAPAIPVPEVTEKAESKEEVSNEPQSVNELPVAPVEQKEEIPSDEPVVSAEITGIDTVGLEEPRGNWLFKKIWWERSEQQNGKILAIIEKIDELKMQFFARRTELDKVIFDPFFVDIGYSQGELLGALSALIDKIERDRKKEGALDEQERELLKAIAQDRELVLQLHRDAQSIALLENAADDLMERVMEQRARVTRYQREAWENMREIARILSDTQARDLYYKVDAAWRNIKNIHRYLEQDLKRYFDQLVTNATEQVERIKTAMQTLKEKGIDLKNSLEHREESEEPESEETSQKEVSPPVAKSWLSRLFAWILQFFSSLLRMLLWLPRKLLAMIRK
jgi:hypothetical protein